MGPNIFNSLLSDYCGSGNYKAVLKLFKEKDDLDLTYGNGVCFKLVIKHSDVKILAVLLEYYQKHKLSGDRESVGYKQALFDLKKILEDTEDMFDFSQEVAEALAPYLCLEGDDNSSQEQDLSGTDNELFGDQEETSQFGDILNCDEWPEHVSSAISGADSFTLQHIDCI